MQVYISGSFFGMFGAIVLLGARKYAFSKMKPLTTSIICNTSETSIYPSIKL